MEGGLYAGCTISSPEGEGNPGRCNWAAGAVDERNWPEATTWPSRSYACAFCRRGFKSAQSLGGHMNVHRRDRALLRQQMSEPCPSAADACSPPYSVMIPPQPPLEFVERRGEVFLLYPIGAGAVIAPALASPPSYLSTPVDPGAGRRSSESTICSDGASKEGGEELDLELRLGR